MVCKRVLEEFEVIESISKCSSSAKIVGIPTNISHIKKSRKNSEYFTAEVGDGKEITVWDYSEKQMEQLKGFQSTKSTVKISDCEVQSSNYSGNLEVVLKNYSKLAESPKKADVCVEPAGIVKLNEIESCANFDRVNVESLVVKLHQPLIYAQENANKML